MPSEITQQTNTTPETNPGASHLPTGSVSSVESSKSTENLIKSLSTQGLSKKVLPSHLQDHPEPMPEAPETEAEEKTSTEKVLEDKPQPEQNSSSEETEKSVNKPQQSTSPETQTDSPRHQFIISPVIPKETDLLPEFNGVSSLSSSPALGSPNTSSFPLPKEDKKPVKFTVRKVSQNTITTPNSHHLQRRTREYAYGNLPQNRQAAQERKTLTKSEQLQQYQAKYDLHVLKISKINKEIDFLTNLLPPYNVEVDYNTRTKITRAIEKLRGKQDEIEKKKYSLGITISRLWREHDDSEIWVRSVSNQ